MRLVCSFPHPDVRIDIATDNVRFIGSRADVISAVNTFCQRCHSIGLILNELPPSPSIACIEKVVVQEADFLGEIGDYIAKTVRMRQKVIDRVVELWDSDVHRNGSNC